MRFYGLLLMALLAFAPVAHAQEVSSETAELERKLSSVLGNMALNQAAVDYRMQQIKKQQAKDSRRARTTGAAMRRAAAAHQEELEEARKAKANQNVPYYLRSTSR